MFLTGNSLNLLGHWPQLSIRATVLYIALCDILWLPWLVYVAPWRAMAQFWNNWSKQLKPRKLKLRNKSQSKQWLCVASVSSVVFWLFFRPLQATLRIFSKTQTEGGEGEEDLLLRFLLNELLSSSNAVGLLKCHKAHSAPRLSLWTDRQRLASPSRWQMKRTAMGLAQLPRLLEPTADNSLCFPCLFKFPEVRQARGRERGVCGPMWNKEWWGGGFLHTNTPFALWQP